VALSARANGPEWVKQEWEQHLHKKVIARVVGTRPCVRVYRSKRTYLVTADSDR